MPTPARVLTLLDKGPIPGRTLTEASAISPILAGPGRRWPRVYSTAVTVLGGELAVPCTRNPL